MPDEDVVWASVLGSYNATRLDREFKNTGLRSQLAALENVHHGYVVCGRNIVNDIEDRITELRKELEG